MAGIVRRGRYWDALDLLEQMGRGLDSFFGGSPTFGRSSWPPLDIRQDGDKYMLEADILHMEEGKGEA